MDKPQNIFDHLKNITTDKSDYLGDEGWGKWMVQRYLSMNRDYIEAVNIIQVHSWQMPNERLYKVYKDIIPKNNVYLKYIKASKKKEYKEEEVEAISDYFEVSKYEAKEYIDALDKKEIKLITEQYNLK
jgi:hypothetical protein